MPSLRSAFHSLFTKVRNVVFTRKSSKKSSTAALVAVAIVAAPATTTTKVVQQVKSTSPVAPITTAVEPVVETKCTPAPAIVPQVVEVAQLPIRLSNTTTFILATPPRKARTVTRNIPSPVVAPSSTRSFPPATHLFAGLVADEHRRGFFSITTATTAVISAPATPTKDEQLAVSAFDSEDEDLFSPSSSASDTSSILSTRSTSSSSTFNSPPPSPLFSKIARSSRFHSDDESEFGSSSLTSLQPLNLVAITWPKDLPTPPASHLFAKLVADETRGGFYAA